MIVRRATDLFDTCGNAAIRLFFAPVCASCDEPLDRPLAGPVCDACWQAVPLLTPPWCPSCGDPLPGWQTSPEPCVRCRREPPAFETARSVGRYDGSLRAILHAFKYEHRRLLAIPLAARLRDAGRDLLADAHAVVPVPLHPWRALNRGFNQADDLARGLGRPVWPVLRRRRHGPPQAGLPAARRQANVRDAYALRWLTMAGRQGWHRPSFDGAVLVLVDDVMTTGATLDACSRVLRAAGARTVRALTVARAASGPPLQPPPSPRPAPARRR